MKKVAFISLCFAFWFIFQLQGCQKKVTETITEIEYDTIYIFDTTYVDTSVHTDSSYERPNLYLFLNDTWCSGPGLHIGVTIINPDEYPAFNIQLHMIAYVIDVSNNEFQYSVESYRNVVPIVFPPLFTLEYYSFVLIDCYPDPDSLQPTWETRLDTCWISWDNSS